MGLFYNNGPYSNRGTSLGIYNPNNNLYGNHNQSWGGNWGGNWNSGTSFGVYNNNSYNNSYSGNGTFYLDPFTIKGWYYNTRSYNQNAQANYYHSRMYNEMSRVQLREY